MPTARILRCWWCRGSRTSSVVAAHRERTFDARIRRSGAVSVIRRAGMQVHDVVGCDARDGT
jgi:hypothetical protein